MLKKPLLKIRDIKELQASQKQSTDDFITPFKIQKSRKPRISTAKKAKIVSPPVEQQQQPLQSVANEQNKIPEVPATPKTLVKRSAKSARREPPPNQKLINSYFKTCEKTYKIETLTEEPPTPSTKKAATEVKIKGKRTATDLKKKPSGPPKTARKMGRKRLFVDDVTETEDDLTSGSNQNENSQWKPSVRKKAATTVECITILSDSEEEQVVTESKKEDENKGALKKSPKSSNAKNASSENTSAGRVQTDSKKEATSSSSNSPPTTSLTSTNDRGVVSNLATPLGQSSVTDTNSKTAATTKRKPKPCPPYKVVEGTTFAVDAFQFGYINDVTHYFLTHFHADHYIGLTRKFAMPLYLTPITARLVRAFIPIEEEYIHELELNKPITVAGIEVTALDANHCPGAIMLLFTFQGKSVLHTGDFRAWHGMESEPAFWNNDIHTVYLDTTYISNKYAFSTQDESIDKALDLMDKFREKHSQNRILYVCGSYVIGKEKFWSAIAEEYQLKVWTEPNRYKALKAINEEEYTKHLVEDSKNADMHVIAMGKLSYLHLVEYFASYEQEYDMLLAIRPSGWEKDSKPQYRGKINIIGIEYSEHSSFEEMQRFVKFLKPQKVISTVPFGRDLMTTPKVPEKWYKYKKLQSSSNYQPRIEQYMGAQKKKTDIRMPNETKGGLETFVSPIKKQKARDRAEINNNNNDGDIVSVKSAEPCTAVQAKAIAKQLQSMSSPESSDSNRNAAENLLVKLDYVEGKINTRANNKYLKSQAQTVAGHIKKKPISPDNKADAIISQTLEKGESSNILVSTTSGLQTLSQTNSSDFFESSEIITNRRTCNENTAAIKGANNQQQQITSVSRSNSSELFEPTSIKNRKLHIKDSSSSGAEIPVSQKRVTRLASKQNKVPSVASTVSENQLAFEIQLLQKTQEHLANSKLLPESKRLRVNKINPLLKSTSSSSASSINEDHSISKVKGNVIFRNNLLVAQSEQIPPSQTTTDLENNPRPLRNRIKAACSQLVTSVKNEQTSVVLQTTNDLVNTTGLLRNKMKSAYLWHTSGDDNADDDADAIAASQTSKDLENTMRPMRNKRLISKNLSLAATSIPERSATTRRKCMRAESIDPLTKILEENRTIDIYNLSQCASLVAGALAEREADKSVEHIPPELLSSPENENNIIDQENFEEQRRACKTSPKRRQALIVNSPPREHYISSSQSDSGGDVTFYDTSKLVKAVVDALSQRQPDKSVDHIPPDLLSPTDLDAEDDWLY